MDVKPGKAWPGTAPATAYAHTAISAACLAVCRSLCTGRFRHPMFYEAYTSHPMSIFTILRFLSFNYNEFRNIMSSGRYICGTIPAAAPGVLAGSQGRGGRADSPTVHVRRGARWAGVITTKNGPCVNQPLCGARFREKRIMKESKTARKALEWLYVPSLWHHTLHNGGTHLRSTVRLYSGCTLGCSPGHGY